jgi:hypothetical protein
MFYNITWIAQTAVCICGQWRGRLGGLQGREAGGEGGCLLVGAPGRRPPSGGAFAAVFWGRVGLRSATYRALVRLALISAIRQKRAGFEPGVAPAMVVLA